MKILLDLQGVQTESRLRGIGRQARSLAKAILRLNRAHDISILLNGGLRDNLPELLDELTPLVPKGQITVFNPPGAVAERNAANLWRTYAAEHLRERTVARLAPDLIHVSSLFEGFVDDAVSSVGHFETGILTVVTLHDLIPLVDPERYLKEQGPRRHWLRRAQALKRADLLLSVSESSKREAIEYLHIDPARIAVILAGVDPSFRADGVAETGLKHLQSRYDLSLPFILYVGAVDPRKNPEILIEAFARLPSSIRSSHLLVFAGKLFDDEMSKLRLAAARHGVPSAALRFCQHVSDEDLIGLYQASAAFVFPSTHEGFGLPALEAMACGTPVLASQTTSLPEVVGNDTYLFDPRDAADLAAKIQPLLCDADARTAARDWGVRRAADFTWDRSASLALAAFEQAFDAGRGRLQRDRAGYRSGQIFAKLRMAFVSPLPPDQSGIATYSAALLRELGRFYAIECIVPGANCDDPWTAANFPLRDVPFFERNATSYDRIVYSFGNSHFHAHMLGLVERFPGIVILHDFFLSDLIEWMSHSALLQPEGFARELYRSHGLSALVADKRLGRSHSIDTYPANGVVFRSAEGVVVHSQYSAAEARRLFGANAWDRTTVIPHLKAIPAVVDRERARQRLGLADDDLLVCSFGILTARKRSRDLLDAWLSGRQGARKGARLVYVGSNEGGAYGAALVARMEAARGTHSVTITGYADDDLYHDYLAAADVAVQLRATSRGETSGTILDCLAHGLSVVFNGHGPAAEYPDDIAIKLPDAFTPEALRDAIDALCEGPTLRATLGSRGRDYVREHHNPLKVGRHFYDAIEAFASTAAGDETVTLDAIARISVPVAPDSGDLREVAAALSVGEPRIGARQILFDVTVLAEHDARTGIQRVVRAILQQLVADPPDGFRIEPVRMDGSHLRYARRFSERFFETASTMLDDDVCSYARDDLYLSIDWVPDRLPDVEAWLSDFRLHGGRIVIGVHDLLPFQMPQFFPDFMPGVMLRWFESSLRVAHQFVCVSAAVADDVIRIGTALDVGRRIPVAVDFFHNAADLGATVPTMGIPADGKAVLAAMKTRPTFLMVGTVEPRKGHWQTVRGFELLWREQVDVALVIIGKKGWMMDELAAYISSHTENGGRLIWMSDVSDEYLGQIYQNAAALIAASEGEGFGLPLVEAARLGTPLIARNLPVFREVVGEHAFFFEGTDPRAVAKAIEEWLALARAGQAPAPHDLATKDWKETTSELIALLFGDTHYGSIA